MAEDNPVLDRWEARFKSADKDNNGSLSSEEFTDMLRQDKCKLPESQIEKMFVFFDGPKGDRRITLEELLKGVKALQELAKELLTLFRGADTDRSGYLDKFELYKLLFNSKHNFTEDDVERILNDADKDGDGSVSYKEFIAVCVPWHS